MEAGYELAIKEYTKTRKDDEATAMEKELLEFQSLNLPLTTRAEDPPRRDCSRRMAVMKPPKRL